MLCRNVITVTRQSLRSLLFSFFVYTIFLSTSALAIDLPNGGMIEAEISVSGEIDEYTFTASAGDTVYLRIADTETTEFVNSSFFPRVELIDPNGAFIAGSGGALVGDIAQFLVLSGQYTVRARDDSSGEDETGTYDLYFAGVPGANDDGVLPNGGVVSGEIELGDLDSYTFNANAGETVYLRVADTETTEFVDSAFFPNIVLFGPSGEFITSANGALVGDIAQSLVSTGTYTVIINDESSGEDATGSYDLYFAKGPGANDDGVLPNGGVVSGEIELGDLDSYTFTANAGETVYLRVADTETTEFVNSAFFPNIILLGPSGGFITNANGALVGDIAQSLVSTGTYTVIINDESSGEDATGSYDLYFAKGPGASDDGVLPNGGVVSGEIELGDLDSYSFTANAGETVYLRVADTETTEFVDSAFFPNIILLGPSGGFITNANGALVGDIAQTLVSTGTYTVIINDESSGEDATGSYDLYFARAPGANDDGCVADGQSANGFIALGDIDSYSFQANAGTSLLVTVTDLDGGALFPRVLLFSPDGSFITSDQGAVTAQISANLTSTGEFTLLVFDESSGEDATGNYRIDVSGVSVTCPVSECNGLPISVFIADGDLPTSGADVILGTSSADVINALGGNDTICGVGGNDTIIAGGGSDWVDGGSGMDDILGGGGDDIIFGGLGADIIRGGGGDDDIEGEQGDDSLLGQSGNDTLDGGNGIDDINGGAGNDTIFTGSGATVGTGVVVSGGSGSDVINGGPDADALLGSNGADTINGFGGDDVITGGNGQDIIDGGDGDDDIRGQGSPDTLNGGAGDDVINGGEADDTINGGVGNDELLGGAGDDVVRGDTGADMIFGGSGDDRLVGGASGGDVCNGQSGIDSAAASCESQIGVEE